MHPTATFCFLLLTINRIHICSSASDSSNSIVFNFLNWIFPVCDLPSAESYVYNLTDANGTKIETNEWGSSPAAEKVTISYHCVFTNGNYDSPNVSKSTCSRTSFLSSPSWEPPLSHCYPPPKCILPHAGFYTYNLTEANGTKIKTNGKNLTEAAFNVTMSYHCSSKDRNSSSENVFNSTCSDSSPRSDGEWKPALLNCLPPKCILPPDEYYVYNLTNGNGKIIATNGSNSIEAAANQTISYHCVYMNLRNNVIKSNSTCLSDNNTLLHWWDPPLLNCSLFPTCSLPDTSRYGYNLNAEHCVQFRSNGFNSSGRAALNSIIYDYHCSNTNETSDSKNETTSTCRPGSQSGEPGEWVPPLPENSCFTERESSFWLIFSIGLIISILLIVGVFVEWRYKYVRTFLG